MLSLFDVKIVQIFTEKALSLAQLMPPNKFSNSIEALCVCERVFVAYGSIVKSFPIAPQKEAFSNHLVRFYETVTRIYAHD